MNKALTYMLVATAVVFASAGGYYFARTEIVTVEVPSAAASAANQGDSPAPARPEHGNFQKRFEPKPPPPNGGKFN